MASWTAPGRTATVAVRPRANIGRYFAAFKLKCNSVLDERRGAPIANQDCRPLLQAAKLKHQATQDMKLGFHASICDESTRSLADALRPLFDKLSEQLSGEYGGPMEHLWIDVELLVGSAKPDGQPRHTFRLQKRVSGRGHFGLPAIPDRFNVGHYSVRPDFSFLATHSTEESVSHIVQLIYESLTALESKRRRVGDLDIRLLRERFVYSCKVLGVSIQSS